ncbi:MAG: 23S rRNA (adenine(2503)-C(2))-methyltransferase RlmN, partial [Alphaproteobacteria bacterium]
MNRECIKSLPREALEQRLEALGEKAFRARQVFRWLHREDVADFAAMGNVSKALRERLAKDYFILRLPVAEQLTSEDGTRKFALRTPDEHLIECVLIPEPRRLTLCVSTQIGCRFGCGFCRTGTMGLVRNLTPGEIVEQLSAAQRTAPERRITNLVLMGMGEPLDNLENVLDAIRIWRDDHGHNLSPRKITLSTVGLPPQMDELGRAVEVSLAVSLHAADDETRDRLLPINKKYPLAELMDACRRFPLSPRRRITFEYALIKGVNDSPEQAERLVKLVKPLRPKINLIACNPFAGSGFEPPDEEAVL